MKAFCLVLGAAAALIFPATALAVSCASPGTSGVDQYLETIPGASCNTPYGGGAPGVGGRPLGAGTARQLEERGSVGRAVERLVGTTGAGNEIAGAGSRGRGGLATGNPAPSAGWALGDRQAQTGDGQALGKSLPSALLRSVVTVAPAGGSSAPVALFVAGALLVAVCAASVQRRRLRRSRGY